MNTSSRSRSVSETKAACELQDHNMFDGAPAAYAAYLMTISCPVLLVCRQATCRTPACVSWALQGDSHTTWFELNIQMLACILGS